MTLLLWRRNDMSTMRSRLAGKHRWSYVELLRLLRVSAEAKEEAVNGNVSAGRERASAGVM